MILHNVQNSKYTHIDSFNQIQITRIKESKNTNKESNIKVKTQWLLFMDCYIIYVIGFSATKIMLYIMCKTFL